ncbi:MAG: DUF4368 domain-containing protein [Lachnospiraceae bacterium]
MSTYINVNGKLDDERFYKLSSRGQRSRTEAANVAKLIAVTKKYTRIDELTSGLLNAFVDKTVVHEREKKDGKRTQQTA